MPAPIKIKIPSLEKRITGLTSGTSNPSGTNVFNNNTHQNIHKKLQSGLSSFQVGYDFVVGTGEIHNQIKHLFDEDTTDPDNESALAIDPSDVFSLKSFSHGDFK